MRVAKCGCCCAQVMLDNDMILSMLRNVVAGLGFLHGAEPPIIHQELRSIKILLDCSCRAHLSDFQQDVVRYTDQLYGCSGQIQTTECGTGVSSVKHAA